LYPNKEIYQKFSSLLILPWLGWTFLFARTGEIGILIPSVVLSAMFLASGLLPFDEIRLPEDKVFGGFVFPIVFFFYGFLRIIFIIYFKEMVQLPFRKTI
jgi:hypothetical protein